MELADFTCRNIITRERQTMMQQLYQIDLPPFSSNQKDSRGQLDIYYKQSFLPKKNLQETLTVLGGDIDFYEISKSEVDFRLSDKAIRNCQQFYAVVNNKKSDPFYTSLITGYDGDGIVFGYDNLKGQFETDCSLLRLWLNYISGVNCSDDEAVKQYAENIYDLNVLKTVYQNRKMIHELGKHYVVKVLSRNGCCNMKTEDLLTIIEDSKNIPMHAPSSNVSDWKYKLMIGYYNKHFISITDTDLFYDGNLVRSYDIQTFIAMQKIIEQ